MQFDCRTPNRGTATRSGLLPQVGLRPPNRKKRRCGGRTGHDGTDFAVGYTHDPRYTDALKRFQCEATAKDEIIALGN